MPNTASATTGNLVLRAWQRLRGNRSAVVILATMSLLSAQAETAALVLVALIADAVARGAGSVQPGSSLLGVTLGLSQALVLAVLSVVAAATTAWLVGQLQSRRSARLEAQSREQVFDRLAEADWEYQSTQKASRVEGRVRLADAPGILFGSFVSWSRAVLSIAVFVSAAALISPLTALLIFFLGGILSLAVLPLRRQAARLAGISAHYEVQLTDEITEALDHGPDSRVFAAWSRFQETFDEKSRQLEEVRFRRYVIGARFPIVYQYGAITLLLAALGFVALTDVSDGAGGLAATALLLLRSVQYGQSMQQSLHNLAKAVPYVDRLKDELAIPRPRITPGDHPLEGITRIELRRASYTYAGSDSPALSGVDLTIKPGSIVGIAGPSGSGKSTLGQVLLRLRWPTSGEFLVNDRPASDYSEASWLSLVSHVPQTPRLVHGTLLENVTFFDPSVSREAVQKALWAVGLANVDSLLPEGLDTPIGPTTRALSGGQIQRLGIARALVRGAQLVVLDEPTSALDVDAEEHVASALAALASRPDTTVVVIAHRPSTLRLCHEVIVLGDGKVVAHGPLEEVGVRSPFFARVLQADEK